MLPVFVMYIVIDYLHACNMFITLPVQCIFLRAHNELICQIMETEKGTLVIHSCSNVVRQVHMTVYNATSVCDVHSY